MELIYIKVGDYNLPNLTLNSPSNLQINKYGRLRLDYIKENNKALYTTLLMTNELTNHLASVSIESENRLNILMKQYKNYDELLSEKSKMDNQIEWIKLMNNYKNRAEEIILNELIYAENVWGQIKFYVLASTENLLPYVFDLWEIPYPLIKITKLYSLQKNYDIIEINLRRKYEYIRIF